MQQFDDKELKKKEAKPVRGGRMAAPDEFRERLKGRRFIFTVAQNNTKLHEKFWSTLTRMAKKRKAQLCVAKLSYNKNGWQKITTESEGLWYDERIIPYLVTEQVKVADDLVFCGELDLLPTTQFPLTGLDNYTGSNSAIVPHTKVQMKSLATMKHSPAKLLYTTGAVTLRNYIQRRAGQIAEFHHVFGALWVEVDSRGKWFVRQLNADDNGIVYDLDRVWGPTYDTDIKEFGRPDINLGDIHIEKSDDQQMQGALHMLQTLNPARVMIHDLLDMMSRNHHNLKDHHFLVQQGQQTVECDVAKAALWLRTMALAFPETKFIVVRSNHDEALGRWVKNGSGWPDPQNLRYWHELNAYALRETEYGHPVDIFAYALFRAAPDLHTMKNVKFVQEDESYVVNGIEYGMHGHLGPNGSRGNPRNFRQLGVKANTGHTHSAGIIDGIYTSGVLGSLDMGYNKGPSSWSCSHIITYPNAKRTIVTQRGSQWRA